VPPKMRKCTECPRKFPVNRRQMTCTPECRDARHARQLAEWNAGRKVPLKPKRPCDVCGRPFAPAKSDAKYCTDPCRKIGLERAVAQQRKRRRKK